MRVVIAPDSFKGSLSAREAAAAMAEGVRRVLPEAEMTLVPMADGGEGTTAAIVAARGGRYINTEVSGPLGDPVAASFGLIEEDRTAIIEMAAASGLCLIPESRRDPRIASTFGLGELILCALDAGAKRILIGLGGSATNDGGAGMAQALGYRLLDGSGRELPRGGAALAGLTRIDAAQVDARLRRTGFIAACDVTNPLTGPSGASAVYGPQKGADAAAVAELDAALSRLAAVMEADLGANVAVKPGAGAAGGLGAGLTAFCGADLRPGVEMVIDAVGLRNHLSRADLVLTGEGRLDGQTVQGKAPIGLARAAKEFGLPVLAVAGGLGPGYETVHAAGIDAVIAAAPEGMPLSEAMAHARALTADAAERIVRAWMGKLPECRGD